MKSRGCKALARIRTPSLKAWAVSHFVKRRVVFSSENLHPRKSALDKFSTALTLLLNEIPDSREKAGAGAKAPPPQARKRLSSEAKPSIKTARRARLKTAEKLSERNTPREAPQRTGGSQGATRSRRTRRALTTRPAPRGRDTRPRRFWGAVSGCSV